MDWENLAPWIAIAITLALSILVPVFTQIANNRHQQKLQKEQREYEQSQRKRQVYETFLTTMGAFVISRHDFDKIGASLYEMYVYSPNEWHTELDRLSSLLNKHQFDQARDILENLAKKISADLNK
jgi:uncharacterized protein HemX